MSTLIKDWLKDKFIHQASSQTRASSSNRPSAPALFGETFNERCTIVDKPSTMSDADAMRCEDETNQNLEQTSKTSVDPKVSRKDTVVVDRFQACFIDCTCQCEAKKVIPSLSTNGSQNVKSQLMEELFDRLRGSSYEIDCSCDCGRQGLRKLRFSYATGDKSSH